MNGSDHQHTRKTTNTSTKRWSEYSSQYQRVKRHQFSQDVLTAVLLVDNKHFETSQIEFKQVKQFVFNVIKHLQ